MDPIKSANKKPPATERGAPPSGADHEPEGLEDLNVTRPAPIDQEPNEAAREEAGPEESAGLENQSVSQPASVDPTKHR